MVCCPPPHEYVNMAKLTSIPDASLLLLVVEAVKEYISSYECHGRAPDVIRAFVLLCAIKREYLNVLPGILGDQKIEPPPPPSLSLPINTESTELALQFIHGRSRAQDRRPGTPKSEYAEMTLFRWAARKGYRKLGRYC